VSLGSFGIISAVSYLLYQRNLKNDRLLAIFLLCYGSMQLFETLIWLGQEKGAQDLNKIGSIGASALLYSHPLGFMAGLWADKAYKGIGSTALFQSLFAVSVAFFGYGLYQIGLAYTTGSKSLTSWPDSKTGHLIWDFPMNYDNILLFIIFISTIYVLPKNAMAFGILLLYFMIPFAVAHSSGFMQWDGKWKPYGGSYWCWYVAAFSFLLYGINPMLQG